jgi:sRNA-binding regulator protein Hfq
MSAYSWVIRGSDRKNKKIKTESRKALIFKCAIATVPVNSELSLSGFLWI